MRWGDPCLPWNCLFHNTQSELLSFSYTAANLPMVYIFSPPLRHTMYTISNYIRIHSNYTNYSRMSVKEGSSCYHLYYSSCKNKTEKLFTLPRKSKAQIPLSHGWKIKGASLPLIDFEINYIFNAFVLSSKNVFLNLFTKIGYWVKGTVYENRMQWFANTIWPVFNWVQYKDKTFVLGFVNTPLFWIWCPWHISERLRQGHVVLRHVFFWQSSVSVC